MESIFNVWQNVNINYPIFDTKVVGFPYFLLYNSVINSKEIGIVFNYSFNIFNIDLSHIHALSYNKCR